MNTSIILTRPFPIGNIFSSNRCFLHFLALIFLIALTNRAHRYFG